MVKYFSDFGGHGFEWSPWLNRQHSFYWQTFAIKVALVMWVSNQEQDLVRPKAHSFTPQLRGQVADDTIVSFEQPWRVDSTAEYGEWAI